ARRVPVRVVGPQGEPVPDARVTLGYGSVGLLRHTAKTDADGRARVGPVVPGPYMISADADGFLPSEPIGVDVRGDVDPPEHLLTLIAPAGIAGKVVDHGGRAIAGARVVVDGEALYTPATSATRAAAFDAVARPGGSLGVTEGKVPAIPMVRPSQGDALGDGASFTILTDGAGTFQLGALMPGTYRLRAVHDRFAESDEVIVDLAPGQQVTGVRLVLGEGALISGRVRDENGQPIAGVRVEFEDGAAVYTDDRGVFDAGLRRGRQVITLRKQGLIPQVIELDVGEQPVDLERVMAVADGEFEARVRDGNNQPIADVRLSLDPDGELAPVEFAWTDKRGVVELRGLVPGRATVTLEHPDFATVERRVQITTAATLVEFTLEEGWSVIVVVRDEASRDPLADATVEAFGRVHRVGVDGSVVLDQLAVDSFSVTARAPGRVPRTRTVRRDGDDEVLVDLDEGGAVEGQVQDDLGEPVAGAAVRVERRDGEVLARTRTRIDGSFAFQGLGVGDVYVVAEPPIALRALLAETSEATDILGGRVTRDVIVRLQRK
ncbi:MAG: carboxypeptidase regulatory-like domain-containing protein, partial [Myxococcales bacterium]|nr:carboxypeptidase regulatory-like domain-containing protein [Myxococcales bacterium]